MPAYYWEYRGTRLRPLKDDDVDAYLSADLDSEAKRVLNLSIGLPRSRAGQLESLSVDFKNAPKRLDFAIETLDREFVGFCAIDEIQGTAFATSAAVEIPDPGA